MANLYGVANAPGPSVFSQAATNITCPPGVETTVIASPALIATSQGYFLAQVSGQLYINMGATPPTALTVAYKLGAGSDSASYPIPGQYLTANGNIIVPISFLTLYFSTAWQTPGTVINITLNPTAQQVIVFNLCSNAFFVLLRAPDQ